MAIFLRLLSHLPLPALHGLSALVSSFAYYVIKLRLRVVRENMTNAFPELDTAEINQLSRDFYRHYGQVMAEMVRSISITENALLQRVNFSGEEILAEYLKEGRPVLATAAHQCNIEWLLLACSAKFACPFEAVYRPLSDSHLERLTYETHRRFGGTPINDRAVIKEIMARRNEPRIIAIVPDQSPNIGDDKLWTTFLNQQTAFFIAPEVIAKFTKFPVVFLSMRRTGLGRYQVTIEKLAEPPYSNDHTITERYVKRVERQIREDPSNWLWAHKRWKHKRPLYDGA